MGVRSSTRRNKVYKFVHNSDVSVKTNLTGRNFSNDWVEIEEDGTITLKGSFDRGYAWDGCTPKGHFIDLIWGTPDGRLDYRTEKPLTYYASMIHDVIYQFKQELPISRREADILFARIMQESKFMWWWLYGFAVIAFGGFYGKWKTKNTMAGQIKVEGNSWIPLANEQIATQQLATAAKKAVTGPKAPQAK
jgi:hypothetical protein